MRSSEAISSTTGYLLLKLAGLASARMEQALLPLRLRGRDLRVLAFVQDGELTQRDLCRQTGLDRTTMVAVIDELERNGYVRRDRSPSDRRKQFISVTTAGGTALSEALAAVRRTEDDFLAPLREDERLQLHHQLSLLYTAHDPQCRTDQTPAG
ncbi:MarR family winged helix-turn-helix transcriptional regulator [Micromonospora parathelypteridis]|uniref:DNA-binding MarR family transcriptional regulator n=1 Tax=Micromonospora parathelypteridis TaxID=1839617 RepID=A0A840W001_9ACTN|nr:MarR family winged helix-turn-helix transcriptional regulator [Micromonospora parathelypteridis]MBB5479434.1 DNA-binding MarR family transcriptional regulator [Micromonospora parathelypteridis]GGO29887.1 MarR family transcriptional regulator [Micromonospora parathelypteridis]